MPVVLECQMCRYVESVGDMTLPCGTPFFYWRCVDVLFLNVVYALRPLV